MADLFTSFFLIHFQIQFHQHTVYVGGNVQEKKNHVLVYSSNQEQQTFLACAG